MDLVTLTPNQIYKIKKGWSQSAWQNASLNILLFFVPQMGLTRTTIPSNFSRAKQERMKVAATFKWAPTNPITCPNFGASQLVQNEYYL